MRLCQLVEPQRWNALREALEANLAAGRAPCQDLTLAKRNELLQVVNWLEQSRDPTQTPEDPRLDFTGADLSQINFSGVDTIELKLANAILLSDPARANLLRADAPHDHKHSRKRTHKHSPYAPSTQGKNDEQAAQLIQEWTIQNSNELAWIMASRDWSVEPQPTGDRSPKRTIGRKRPKRIRRANLRGAIFAARTGEGWTGDFRGAYLCGADLTGATLAKADFYAARLPFARLNRCDCERVTLNKSDMTSIQANRAEFSRASFVKVNLVRADLRNATAIQAIVRDAFLAGAMLDGATFDLANLTRANLVAARMRATTFVKANLQGVQLEGAKAMQAIFQDADVSGSNLNGVWLDGETQLDDLKFDRLTRFGDIHWNGAALYKVRWDQAKPLGDETFLNDELNRLRRQMTLQPRTPVSATAQKQNRRNHLKSKVNLYRDAARTYHTLRVALGAQRIVGPASRFRLRELQIQRHVVWLRKKGFWWWLTWGFSYLLDKVAGYGEQPQWALRWYVAIISFFAFVDYVAAQFPAAHVSHTLTIFNFLAFSVASFHGRGFFPASSQEIPIGSPITYLAEVEAVIGLLLELTFIGSFTKRFLD